MPTPTKVIPGVDPEDHGVAEARQKLDEARPHLSTAAGSEVGGMLGSHDPLAAVQDALNLLSFDEVIVSMLPDMSGGPSPAAALVG